MKHTTQARYPAPSDVVIRMFCDPGFHKRKLDKLGIKHQILEQDESGDEFRLKVERHVPVKASGIVKKIMPATTQVLNDERWNQSDKTGTVVVETRGVPLDMNCKARMRDDGDECVIEYDWEIKARIPLGGGALEKFVIGDMETSAEEERVAGASFLDDYR